MFFGSLTHDFWMLGFGNAEVLNLNLFPMWYFSFLVWLISVTLLRSSKRPRGREVGRSGTRRCAFCSSGDAVGWVWLTSPCETFLNQAVCLPHDSSSGSKNWVSELPDRLKGMGELDAQFTWVKHFTGIKWTC